MQVCLERELGLGNQGLFYIWQLSSFRAPTLWFIHLIVTACNAIFNHLSEFMLISFFH